MFTFESQLGRQDVRFFFFFVEGDGSGKTTADCVRHGQRVSSAKKNDSQWPEASSGARRRVDPGWNAP